MRSSDVLPLARRRFNLVHEATADRCFPLPLMVDMPAIAREDPALLARLERAEDEAADDPMMQPCTAYAVFRKRA